LLTLFKLMEQPFQWPVFINTRSNWGGRRSAWLKCFFFRVSILFVIIRKHNISFGASSVLIGMKCVRRCVTILLSVYKERLTLRWVILKSLKLLWLVARQSWWKVGGSFHAHCFHEFTVCRTSEKECFTRRTCHRIYLRVHAFCVTFCRASRVFLESLHLLNLPFKLSKFPFHLVHHVSFLTQTTLLLDQGFFELLDNLFPLLEMF